MSQPTLAFSGEQLRADLYAPLALQGDRASLRHASAQRSSRNPNSSSVAPWVQVRRVEVQAPGVVGNDSLELAESYGQGQAAQSLQTPQKVSAPKTPPQNRAASSPPKAVRPAVRQTSASTASTSLDTGQVEERLASLEQALDEKLEERLARMERAMDERFAAVATELPHAIASGCEALERRCAHMVETLRSEVQQMRDVLRGEIEWESTNAGTADAETLVGLPLEQIDGMVCGLMDRVIQHVKEDSSVRQDLSPHEQVKEALDQVIWRLGNVETETKCRSQPGHPNALEMHCMVKAIAIDLRRVRQQMETVGTKGALHYLRPNAPPPRRVIV